MGTKKIKGVLANISLWVFNEVKNAQKIGNKNTIADKIKIKYVIVSLIILPRLIFHHFNILFTNTMVIMIMKMALIQLRAIEYPISKNLNAWRNVWK